MKLNICFVFLCIFLLCIRIKSSIPSKDDFYFDVKVLQLQLENKEGSFSINNLELINIDRLKDFQDNVDTEIEANSSKRKSKSLDTYNLLLHEITFTDRSLNLINRVENIFEVIPLEGILSFKNDLILDLANLVEKEDNDKHSEEELPWIQTLIDNVKKNNMKLDLISAIAYNMNDDLYESEEIITLMILKFDSEKVRKTFEHSLRFKYMKIYNENSVHSNIHQNQSQSQNLNNVDLKMYQNNYFERNSIFNQLIKYPIYYLESNRNNTSYNTTDNNQTDNSSNKSSQPHHSSFIEMASNRQQKKNENENKNKGLLSVLDNEIIIYGKSDNKNEESKLEILKKITYNKIIDCKVKIEKNCVVIPLKSNGISTPSLDICEIKEEFTGLKLGLMQYKIVHSCNKFIEIQVNKLVEKINEKSEDSHNLLEVGKSKSNSESKSNSSKGLSKILEECQDSWASITQFFNGFNSGLLGEKLSYQIYSNKLSLCREQKSDNLHLINEFSKSLGPEYLSYLKNEYKISVTKTEISEKAKCRPQISGVIDFCEDKKDFKTCFCSIFPLSKICSNDYCLLNTFDFECKRYNCMNTSDQYIENQESCICKENPFSLNCRCKHEPLSIDCICLKHPDLDICESTYCDSNPDELLCKCSQNPCLEECSQQYLFKNKHLADPYINIEKKKLDDERIDNEFKKLKEKSPESKKEEDLTIQCEDNDIFCICSKEKDYKQCICSSYPDSPICKTDEYCDLNKSKYECSASRTCTKEKTKIVSGIKIPVSKSDDCYCKSHLDSLDCVCLLNPFSKPCFCRDNPKSKLCLNELCSLNKELRKSVFCCCDASSEQQCSPKFCKQYPDRIDCQVISKEIKSTLKFNCLVNSNDKNCKKETIKYQYTTFINNLSRNSSTKIEKVLGLYDKMLKLNKVMKNLGDSI